VEGWFFGKAQERSSEESEWGLRGSHEEETEPHLLQCVSEGGAKVSTSSSDGVPRRGVSRGAKVACSRSEARHERSGSSLKVVNTFRRHKTKKDRGEDQRTST